MFLMMKKNRTYTPKVFEEKPTKGEKTRWSIYNWLSGCLGVGCTIRLLFFLTVLGLVFLLL
jgi:hypothetical protein